MMWREELTHNFSRRRFSAAGLRLSLGMAVAYLSSCLSNARRSFRSDQPGVGASWTPQQPPPTPTTSTSQPTSLPDDGFDYIVVGSGAGGGPVACNLARAGKRVLLLEAGSADTEKGEDDHNYKIPAFHPLASEDPRLSWNFFVRHGSHDSESEKFVAGKGVLYPRSSTLGGCTAHNAMITMAPHDDDWNLIADLTGDDSWRAENMHKYLEQVESCGYLKPAEAFAQRRGTSGWLPTEQVSPDLLLRDQSLLRIVTAVARKIGLLDFVSDFLQGRLDPNRMEGKGRAIEKEGVFNPPIATRAHRRSGTREYILDTKAHPIHGKFLTIMTDALVSRLVTEDKTVRGVEFLKGKSLYRVDAEHAGQVGARETVYARREVILSAGAFNTPQILKLSGIGPEEELRANGIPMVHHLPGVGENLQDRYEVCVVSELKEEGALTKKCTFSPPADPCFREFLKGNGPYTSSGVAIGVAKKSSGLQPRPDLFIFGIPGNFKGYYPGYSKDALQGKKQFTWAILKAHTENRAGRVTLKSIDPQESPTIDFRYFEEGSDLRGEDLRAVEAGVGFVRSVMSTVDGVIKSELVPGQENHGEALRSFIRKEAWGHHASCSCAMGPASDPMAVVDSRFRVHGLTGLRIVDASIFPRIPGFFIALPIYMASQKASETILGAVP